MPRIPDCPSSWLALKILDLPSQDWCWSWNSNILVTWSEEMTHLETLMLGKIESGRRRDNRGWDGWMESLTQWTWVWLNSRSWWWTGSPGVLQSMGLQWVRHNWATELNWSELSQPLWCISQFHAINLLMYNIFPYISGGSWLTDGFVAFKNKTRKWKMVEE